jgi:malate synthase
VDGLRTRIGSDAPARGGARFTAEAEALCPPEFRSLFLALHRTFEPRRRELLAARAGVLTGAHAGALPPRLEASEEWREGRIEIPGFAEDQRNQMTGPADNAKLAINLCNSGAPGCMLDLEDSITTDWPHVSEGIRNAVAAVHGSLTHDDRRTGRRYAVEPSGQVVYTRPRGMHLDETHALHGETVSASVFDLALILFQIVGAPERRRCFYIPKVESAEEGKWWVELIGAVERWVGLPTGSTKVMFLVESFPAAFQIERLIELTRSHVIGLNLGRWDYMASLIQYKLADPGWILPDRNTIPLDVPFFQGVRKLIVELCNRHGIVPIGGMTALFPSKDPAQNEVAMRVLATDKKLEADFGFRGAWSGHPEQNAVAMGQFPWPEQRVVRYPGAAAGPELAASPTGLGRTTVQGTRDACRTMIEYAAGYLDGRGATLIEGRMEDLATYRIYVMMVAQRIRHGVADEATGERHTRSLVTRLFDEELSGLRARTAGDPVAVPVAEFYEAARALAEEKVLSTLEDPLADFRFHRSLPA